MTEEDEPQVLKDFLAALKALAVSLGPDLAAEEMAAWLVAYTQTRHSDLTKITAADDEWEVTIRVGKPQEAADAG